MAADLVPVPTGFRERLSALGVDVARVVRLAKITHDDWVGGDVSVTTREFFAFWRALEAAGTAADIGLRLGASEQGSPTGLASIAVLASPNLGAALARLARYKRLVCPEQITVDLVGDEAHIRHRWLLAEEEPSPLLLDGIHASVLALARQGTCTPMVPRRIERTRQRACVPMLRAHFGCEVRIDAPADVLVLDRRTLDAPFVTYDARFLETLVPGLDAALKDDGGESLANDVRAALGEQLCGERPAVAAVARAIGMSARTLQRRLEAAGTSYQDLLDDVRRRSARRLLAHTNMAPSEIAFVLGFEEVNSFARAFRRWEGSTPARWRVTTARPLTEGVQG